MGIKDQIIRDAVAEMMEQSDLEPGEVNSKITRVMEVMGKSQERFKDIESTQHELIQSAEGLDSSSKQIAEAGVEMAQAAQQIGKRVDEFNQTSAELTDSLAELQKTLEKFEQQMPEE